MALSPSSPSESSSPGDPSLRPSPPAPPIPAEIDTALSTAVHVDVLALQRSVLAFGCLPSSRATSWRLLSGVWPSSRELWQFADEASLEGEGHLLRLLPLLAPSSPPRIPVALKPLLLPLRSSSESAGHLQPARPLNDRLLQRVRNKLRRPLAAPINITTHNLTSDRLPRVDSLVSPAQPVPKSRDHRDRLDSFPGFDVAHSSHFGDDDDLLQLADGAEDNACDFSALPEGDADSHSSDSECAYPQFKSLAAAAPASPSPREDLCRSVILLLHSRVTAALGCRANRVWASIVQFMNLPTITSTLSLVLLPAIDHSSEREVHLGILQCASLTQHVLLCSLLLVPHLRALCPLEQISEDSFSFWPLMNDVGRQLQRRGVVLRHSDGKCIGVEQFCLKWFRTLFCCCFECADLSVLVLDRLIAHCHTSPSLMRDAAQQRSLMSHALLAIAVELATFVSANPDPHLSTLESLHVLRMSEEQLLLLLGKAAGRMQF